MVFEQLDTVLNNALILCRSPDPGELQRCFQTDPAYMIFIKAIMKPGAAGDAKRRNNRINPCFHAIFAETGLQGMETGPGLFQVNPAFQTFFWKKKCFKHPGEGESDFTGI